MQYGEIVSILLVLLILYYAALIALDIYKAGMAKAAEQEGHSEEEIDISDEARTFKPVFVSRDEPAKEIPSAENTETTPEQPSQPGRQGRRPGYREAVMTDGIIVEDLLEEVNRLAETGTSALGTVVYTCENAR